MRANAVDQSPEEQETDAVGGLEPEDDIAVAGLRPAVELLERRLQTLRTSRSM